VKKHKAPLQPPIAKKTKAAKKTLVLKKLLTPRWRIEPKSLDVSANVAMGYNDIQLHLG